MDLSGVQFTDANGKNHIYMCGEKLRLWQTRGIDRNPIEPILIGFNSVGNQEAEIIEECI